MLRKAEWMTSKYCFQVAVHKVEGMHKSQAAETFSDLIQS
jgi:hypothetical protein